MNLSVSVENMKSSRGNIVPNQFIIGTDNGIYFQSYATTICFIRGGKLTIKEGAFNYSRTTSKYLNQFLYAYFPYIDVKKYIKEHKADADANGLITIDYNINKEVKKCYQLKA